MKANFLPDSMATFFEYRLKQQPDNKALTRKLIELYQVLNMEHELNQACQQFADRHRLLSYGVKPNRHLINNF